MPPDLAVRAEGLTKRYGAVHALAGLDLAVPAGTVLGLLGPNGAGKTTAVRILATLALPDAGRAEVAGVDVLRRPRRVRELIGLAGQYAAVDEKLTGRDNLRMFARLARLPRARAAARADELLERFGLADAADRIVGGYSGGMRRRLDLAASLLVRPPVLFLDEPTTGLDPRSRNGIWTEIRALAADGTAILLTSQYLDEVDRLADRVAVVDAGRAVAEGTPLELKDAIGVPHLHLSVDGEDDIAPARRVLERIGRGPVAVDAERRALDVAAPGGFGALTGAVAALTAAAVRVVDIALARPTLDQVFLHVTGENPRPSETWPTEEGAA